MLSGEPGRIHTSLTRTKLEGLHFAEVNKLLGDFDMKVTG